MYIFADDFSVLHASHFRPPVKFKCLDGFLGVGAQEVGGDHASDLANLTLEVRITDLHCQTVHFSRPVRSAARLLADVRAISFTGSTATGNRIVKSAGLKKLKPSLGPNVQRAS